jgi:hypothetical protein
LAGAALAAAVMASIPATSAMAGTLFVGSDSRTFDGVLPDVLGVVTTNGANFVSQVNHDTTFHINGMTDVSGQNFLYAGDPFGGVINKVSYTGALLGSVASPIATGCCNEDMIWTGSALYHAQFNDGIQLIDVTTGNVLSDQPMPDVVGMSYVGGDIWISQWAGRTVGIWNPVTDAYTPMFSTPDNAGGLAYDRINHVMWVGMEGGSVVPYTLAGVQINAGFQPFGPTPDTIDGLAYLSEARVPEPSVWAMALAGFGLLGAALRRRSAIA